MREGLIVVSSGVPTFRRVNDVKEARMRGRMVKIGAGAVAVLALVGGGVAWATGAGDNDKPLSGAARERAVEAALAHTKGGTVTETETGDDGAAYGVEVRLSDGRQVEVELDENFNVIGQEGDDDKGGEDEGQNHD
jgi:Peptidase propeptide and YPEB domain